MKTVAQELISGWENKKREFRNCAKTLKHVGKTLGKLKPRRKK